MDWILEHWDDVLAVYGAIVVICSVIVKYTPSTKDDEILEKVVKILDKFSVSCKKKD